MKRRHVMLDRALSKLGFASRASARRLILEGRVAVDGRIVRDPATAFIPEAIAIEIDGVVQRRPRWVCLAFNKPRGVVTTRRDPDGRPTVYDYLEGVDRSVMAVGRLDLASTGLLLLTNDTGLANWLTDPRNRIVRRYVVTVRDLVTPETARALTSGVGDRGETLRASGVEVLKRSKRESHLVVELVEGRNRELRRMFGACGHDVTRLKRIAFGGIALGDLEPGRWRELSRAAIDAAFPGVTARSASRSARTGR